ncbi:MAG: cation transporter [Nitriliruptoraceae bacterium]
MATTTYRVSGMTCGHCKSAVEREVGELEGVDAALVDLEAETVTVTGDVDEAEVADAVAEAGYTLERAG